MVRFTAWRRDCGRLLPGSAPLAVLASALLATAGGGVSVEVAATAAAAGRASSEAFGASGAIPSNAAELDALVRNGATD